MMKYYSATKKNEIMPFAAPWMGLEIIVRHEISQTEKDNYHMISLIFAIQFLKKCTNEFLCKTKTELKQISKTNLWLPKGRCVGRGINQELGIHMHTLLGVR